MATDAHDDPYRPQHRRFVLPCSECRAEERVYGLLLNENRTMPEKPLCRDCADMYLRVWGETQGSERSPLSMWWPPEHDLIVDDPNDDGVLRELYVVLCPRCNGTGLVDGRSCFQCFGARYSFVDDKGIQRTARWWQTFQQNRTEEGGSHAKADTKPSS